VDLPLQIIGPTGRVRAASGVSTEALPALPTLEDRPEVVAALQTGALAVARRTASDRPQERVYVAVPVWQGTPSAGLIRVSRSADRADAPVAALYRLLAVALPGGLLVVLFMTWLATGSMDRDLRVLLQHTAALARGEAVVPVQIQSSGALAGIAGSVDQMAQETQRAVRALADERQRSAIVLRAVREGLFSVDRSGRLSLVNPACAELLGLQAEDKGRALHEVVDCPALGALMVQAREAGEAGGDVRAPMEAGAEERVLRVRVTPGEDDGLVVSLADVTHLRRLETIRRDFVANVSHELRTPISIVQASAEALQDGALEDPHYSAQFLDAILRNTDRLALLTRDILQLSRIEAGKWLPELEEVSVSEVVVDVIEILHQKSRERKQQLVSTVDPAVVVRADAGSLEQVLVNLLENAMKYTPKKGSIRVSSVEEEGRVRILVVDHGPGIASHHRERIFERFYRVDPGRSRQEGGTGLGLAIVKHLVESMGGEVGMEPNPDGGSIFWFALTPARDAAPHSPD
jgi:two-component system phosphate regulon sensor histidine kinase PhoR